MHFWNPFKMHIIYIIQTITVKSVIGFPHTTDQQQMTLKTCRQIYGKNEIIHGEIAHYELSLFATMISK